MRSIRDVQLPQHEQDLERVLRKLLYHATVTVRSGEAVKVFSYIMGKMDFSTNVLEMSQEEIAQALRMHKSNVSRAIKVLVEKGLILKEKRGRHNAYALNPNPPASSSPKVVPLYPH